MPAIVPSELPALAINFEYGDSEAQGCTKLPLDLYKQFTAPNKTYEGYGFLEVNVSIVVIPDDIDQDWWQTPESKWMRQKVRRAQKLGYEFRPFEHNDFIDDIHEVNTSMEDRQGRPMSESYRSKPAPVPALGEQPCPRHRQDYFGVFKDGKLYAYTQVMQCGEMLLYSRILGHGDFMEDGIMNLLVFEVAKQRKEESGTRYAVYFLHHSGTEGLQFFKRKMGFTGYTVHWDLARPGVAVPDIPVQAPPAKPKVSPLRRVYRGVARRVPAVKAVGRRLRGVRSGK